jgi:ABC-type Zn uptake system ZnuABC Zn-binding protein ZnuA
MLARTIGGDTVSVTVLSPPDRDAHYLLAQPSMMLALRRADLLVASGQTSKSAGWPPLYGARATRESFRDSKAISKALRICNFSKRTIRRPCAR